jgi:drug/metabolite transporter (DMT)-like permease
MSARRQYSARQLLVADGVLVCCAALFGSSFVGMKLGMSFIGPFTFNFAKILLGVLILLPFRSRIAAEEETPLVPSDDLKARPHDMRQLVIGGLCVGLAMFAGTSLQQLGIVYTTAGKTGFITGFYMPLTAVFTWLGGGKPSVTTCLSVLASVFGLYLLSVEPNTTFTFGKGETLVAFAAFFLAMDVYCTDWFLEKWNLDPTMFSLSNHLWAGIFSLVLALVAEGPQELKQLNAAKWAIIFTGVVDVLGYTFSVIGQQKAPPTHAALLLGLEGPIAMFGGWLAFGETLNVREGTGALIMLGAAVMSQVSNVCSRSDDELTATLPISSKPVPGKSISGEHTSDIVS